jgi:hypothetical protein
VVTSGLVAYYTFDNGNCNEALGNTQFNGVKTGSGTPVYSTDIPNESGKSLQLNNDASFIVGQSPFKDNPKFSYSIWLKMTANCTVFTNGVVNYTPRMAVVGNQISPYYGVSYGFNMDVSNKLLDGQWHFVVVTYERNTSGGRVFTLYIDCNQEKELNISSDLVVADLSLQLGKDFTGKMDNFRVYNRVLTSSEVLQIYSARQ